MEDGSSHSVPGSSSASESALDVPVPLEKRLKTSPKLHSLPGIDAPLGLIAAMSLRTAEVAADEDDSSNSNGYSFDIANRQFFVRPPTVGPAFTDAPYRLRVIGAIRNQLHTLINHRSLRQSRIKKDH
jgi:hypothetical protein